MLVYYFGRLYYSAPLVWLSASAVFFAAPAGVLIWRLLNSSEYGVKNLPDEVIAWLWVALDHALAGTLLSGVLWSFMTYNLTPGYLHSGRAELYALRAASALLVACGAICLVAQLLPRAVLAASTTLYVGLSINLSCWWASLWLNLQSNGIFSLLPQSLLHLLKHERPVDWLRRDMWGIFLERCRQLVPLLLLPEEDLDRGLAILPPSLRARLEQRGLAHAVLPTALCQLLEPWERGPDYLRVRPVPLVPRRERMPHANGQQRRSHQQRRHLQRSSSRERLGTIPEASASDDDTVDNRSSQGENSSVRPPVQLPAPPQVCAPEWLLLYAMRRHVISTISARLRSAPATSALTVATLAAALLAGRHGLSPRRRRELLVSFLTRLLPAAALATYGYRLLHGPDGRGRRSQARAA
jgi:hypothetical protein